jgi:hypothetical protein
MIGGEPEAVKGFAEGEGGLRNVEVERPRSVLRARTARKTGWASFNLLHDDLEMLIMTLCLEELYGMPPPLDPRPHRLATSFRHS